MRMTETPSTPDKPLPPPTPTWPSCDKSLATKNIRAAPHNWPPLTDIARWTAISKSSVDAHVTDDVALVRTNAAAEFYVPADQWDAYQQAAARHELAYRPRCVVLLRGRDVIVGYETRLETMNQEEHYRLFVAREVKWRVLLFAVMFFLMFVAFGAGCFAGSVATAEKPRIVYYCDDDK